MSQEEQKRAAGYKAATFIKDGMRVGLGTGSTAFFFIEKLIERVQQGLKIQAISSSKRSSQQAKEGGIPLLDISEVSSIDLTVDGADEIDPHFQMIKGGGGALLREKIVAQASKEMIVIIDEKKSVAKLGKQKLPVEVIPFLCKATIRHIEELGFHGEIRKTPTGEIYITDNGNQIYDIHFRQLRESPKEDHQKLIQIPGVVETGFFFDLAKKILIGKEHGNVEVKEL